MKKFLFLSLSFFLISFFLISCQQQNMDTDNSVQNKATLMKIYQAFENGNADELDNNIANDVVDHAMDTAMTKKQGLEGVKDYLRANHKAFPDTKFKINAMVASGDTVICYYTFTGTNSGPMMGMPATNKSVKSDGVDIVVFKDGKAVEHWGVQDNLAIMEQLGMMPPMGMESPQKKKK
jgi:predicted ester cyclase